MRKMRISITVLALLVTSGCASTGNNGFWHELGEHSYSSVKQKSVWMPLAAAAVFGATSADHEVSEWAIEKQPIFGSTNGASNWSDILSNGLVLSALVTSFMQREEGFEPLKTDLLALGSAYYFTAGMKKVADRTRPDGSNRLSFPSLHASSAFSAAQVTARNISAYDTSHPRAIRTGLFALASGAAWARVEAARHYPADVLAGAAIGNFFASIGNAFIADRENVAVSYVPTPDGGELRVQWLFK